MSDPISCLNAHLEGRYTVERKLGEAGKKPSGCLSPSVTKGDTLPRAKREPYPPVTSATVAILFDGASVRPWVVVVNWFEELTTALGGN